GGLSARSPRGRPSRSRNGANSIAVIAPSCSTTRRSPTGEGITVHMSVSFRSVEEGLPEMELGVGAPRPPSLGQGVSVRGVATELSQSVADPDVGGEEDVGMTEGAQRDVIGRPGADAGDRQQVAACAVTVGAAL